MANTYTQIYIHVVFAVQERACLIKKEWREELFKYIAGILKNKGIKLLAIGGVEDHIHILFSLDPKMALSDLVRDVKANSSKFINEKGFVLGKFDWQEGLRSIFVFAVADRQGCRICARSRGTSQPHARLRMNTSSCWIDLRSTMMRNICSNGSVGDAATMFRSYGTAREIGEHTFYKHVALMVPGAMDAGHVSPQRAAAAIAKSVWYGKFYKHVTPTVPGAMDAGHVGPQRVAAAVAKSV